MRPIAGFFRSRPLVVDGTLISVALGHCLLTLKEVVPNFWDLLIRAKDPGADVVYSGALGPAAIVAGFAGVVVVFGATASGERFSILRVNGGEALKSNWLSSSMSGFTAVLLFLAALLVHVMGFTWYAPFLYEAGLMILAHGSLRVMWIMYQLIEVVRVEDMKQLETGEPLQAEELFRGDGRKN